MLTVHKMPLKNQFLTGISSWYDKISDQNELQPITMLGFTSDCTFDFLGKESCHGITSTFAGTEIHYSALAKHVAELISCTGDFYSTGTRNTNFEIETIKGDKFLLLFPIYDRRQNGQSRNNLMNNTKRLIRKFVF